MIRKTFAALAGALMTLAAFTAISTGMSASVALQAGTSVA
jgi:hypothetical protein